MKNKNRVLPVLGVAAVLTAAVPSPSPSAAATDTPREPKKAPTGDTSASTSEHPLLGTMLQFVADSIETQESTQASPNRPPDRPPHRPGQNNPPNPPGKPPVLPDPV